MVAQLFGRKPDFEPADDLAEWEVAPNSWLQISRGTRVAGGRIRFGVADIEQAQQGLEGVGIQASRPERLASVLRCDFQDKFGNELGFFQDLP